MGRARIAKTRPAVLAAPAPARSSQHPVNPSGIYKETKTRRLGNRSTKLGKDRRISTKDGRRKSVIAIQYRPAGTKSGKSRNPDIDRNGISPSMDREPCDPRDMRRSRRGSASAIRRRRDQATSRDGVLDLFHRQGPGQTRPTRVLKRICHFGQNRNRQKGGFVAVFRRETHILRSNSESPFSARR